ncbi:MAG: hypothetical protein IGS39_23045 [Calothrix sp. C42_A2020_038]|nr:hypothetical protein [Calothrix sp. C42_A2020_038]
METLNRNTWIKGLAVILTASAINFFVNLPIQARTNPNPSIFKEFPYNRVLKGTHRRRSKLQPKYLQQVRVNARIKKQQHNAINRKPTYTNVPKQQEIEPRYIEFRAPGY